MPIIKQKSCQYTDGKCVAVIQTTLKSVGWSAAVRRAELSLSNGGDETAPQNETDAMFNASIFTKQINKKYFEQIFVSHGKKDFEYNSPYPVINYGVVNGVPTNDLAAAYGNVGGTAAGTFSSSIAGGKINWSIDVDFSFADTYDFGGTDPFSSAFRRLQENGLASIYTTTGSFSKNYSGSVPE